MRQKEEAFVTPELAEAARRFREEKARFQRLAARLRALGQSAGAVIAPSLLESAGEGPLSIRTPETTFGAIRA